jgi:predicted P-loop ATPase
MQRRGKWISELSELDALSKSETSKTKAFISRQIDNYRPPYGRTATDVTRQGVFAGSVNHDAYLKDETGNRRFWPVRIGVIDLSKLRADRDQLWAEAFALYSRGEHWHLDSQELIAAAQEHQQDRVEEDAWHGIVAEYCRVRSDVSVEEVLEDAIRKPREHWNQQDRNRVGRCLRMLGYERYRASRTPEGDRQWRWRQP